MILNSGNIKIKYLNLLINILSLGFYLFYLFILDINIGETLFVSTDSKEYLLVSDEIFHFDERGYSITRPFFYPFIIYICNTIGGFKILWLLQFLFWIGSINLIYFALNKKTKKGVLSCIAAFLMAINFSFIALTFHALTEVITIFLLSALVYFIANNINNYKSTYFIRGLLLFFALLTVVKPLFTIPLYALIFIAVIQLLFISKRKFIDLSLMVLVISPLIIQLCIMKIKYDKLTVSEISTLTLKRYLIAQGLEAKYYNNDAPKMDWEYFVLKSEGFTNKEIYTELKTNSELYYNLFVNNIRDNLNGYPTFLLFPENNKNEKLASFMQNFNKVIFNIHFIFILPILFLIALFLKKKLYSSLIIIVGFLLLLYYIILTSGISFWAGDRLLIITIPIWIFLYAFILNYFVDNLKMRHSKKV